MPPSTRKRKAAPANDAKKLTKEEKKRIQERVKKEMSAAKKTKASSPPAEVTRPTKRRRTISTPPKTKPAAKKASSAQNRTTTRRRASLDSSQTATTAATKHSASTKKALQARAKAAMKEHSKTMRDKKAKEEESPPVEEEYDVSFMEEEQDSDQESIESVEVVQESVEVPVVQEVNPFELRRDSSSRKHATRKKYVVRSPGSARKYRRQLDERARAATKESSSLLHSSPTIQHHGASLTSPPDAAAGVGLFQAPQPPAAVRQEQEAAFQEFLATSPQWKHLANYPTPSVASNVLQDAASLQFLVPPTLNQVADQVKQQERQQQAWQDQLERDLRHQQQATTSSYTSVVQEEPPKQRRWLVPQGFLEKDASWFRWFLDILVAYMAVLVAMAAVKLGSRSSSSGLSVDSPSTGHPPPCYESTYYQDDDQLAMEAPPYLVDKGIHACVPGVDRIEPCPTNGLCKGGFLVECPESLYLEPSEAGTECVLTENAMATIASIQNTLVNSTVDYHCQFLCSFLETCMAVPQNMSGVVPMFDLEEVLESTDLEGYHHVDPSLLSLATESIQVDTGNETTILVGLTDDYVKNDLPIPWSCWCSNAILDVFVFGWICVVTVLNFACKIVVKAPLVSLLVFLVGVAVYQWRRSRRQRAELQETVATVRDLVYLKLQNYGSAIILPLRDEVAHELDLKRGYANHQVWPRVVAQVSRDHRVQKEKQAAANGRPVDVWRWVGPAPTKVSKKQN